MILLETVYSSALAFRSLSHRRRHTQCLLLRRVSYRAVLGPVPNICLAQLPRHQNRIILNKYLDGAQCRHKSVLEVVKVESLSKALATVDDGQRWPRMLGRKQRTGQLTAITEYLYYSVEPACVLPLTVARCLLQQLHVVVPVMGDICQLNVCLLYYCHTAVLKTNTTAIL